MYFQETLFGSGFLFVCNLLAGISLLFAIFRSPWRALRTAPNRLHILFGSIATMLLLWILKAELTPMVGFHLLGITTVSLLLGLPLALLAGSLVTILHLLLLDGSPNLWGLHWLLNVTVPVFVTLILLKGLRRLGPRNLFVYMLGVGFLGGGISMLAVVIATLLVFSVTGHLALVEASMDQAFLGFLLIFPEAFINGMLVTGFAVYCPQWLKTLDEKYYLDDR